MEVSDPLVLVIIVIMVALTTFVCSVIGKFCADKLSKRDVKDRRRSSRFIHDGSHCDDPRCGCNIRRHHFKNDPGAVSFHQRGGKSSSSSNVVRFENEAFNNNNNVPPPRRWSRRDRLGPPFKNSHSNLAPAAAGGRNFSNLQGQQDQGLTVVGLGLNYDAKDDDKLNENGEVPELEASPLKNTVDEAFPVRKLHFTNSALYQEVTPAQNQRAPLRNQSSKEKAIIIQNDSNRTDKILKDKTTRVEVVKKVNINEKTFGPGNTSPMVTRELDNPVDIVIDDAPDQPVAGKGSGGGGSSNNNDPCSHQGF